jgi:hypothetical protein
MQEFQPGELVRLIGEIESYTPKFQNSWNDKMRERIGMVGRGVVTADAEESGVVVDFNYSIVDALFGGFSFPHSELRRVGQGRWAILN